jgi:ATP-dependent protease HslVU (ClpYQ) peptidase subunit
MMFGPLEVTILVRQGTHIYARKGTGLTIQIDDDKWTVTSVEVFATGTISYSAP